MTNDSNNILRRLGFQHFNLFVFVILSNEEHLILGLSLARYSLCRAFERAFERAFVRKLCSDKGSMNKPKMNRNNSRTHAAKVSHQVNYVVLFSLMLGLVSTSSRAI